MWRNAEKNGFNVSTLEWGVLFLVVTQTAARCFSGLLDIGTQLRSKFQA